MRAHPEARIAPVLPHWVDTCIAYATLVAFTPFEFPEPAVLAHPTAAGGGAAAGGGTETMSDERRLAVAQMVGKAEFARRAADAGEGGASGAGRVWAGRKVRFGADLGVGAARLESWVARVEDGGGQVVDDVREADVYIGQYRDGREFNQVRGAPFSSTSPSVRDAHSPLSSPAARPAAGRQAGQDDRQPAVVPARVLDGRAPAGDAAPATLPRPARADPRVRLRRAFSQLPPRRCLDVGLD